MAAVHAAAAAEVGFRAVHALPIGCAAGSSALSTCSRGAPAHLRTDSRARAGRCADVATVALLQERAIRPGTILAEQLQSALNSRVVIEQAKGILAASAGLSLNAAFSLMRAHARSNHLHLSAVAAEVIAHTLTATDLQAANG